MNPLRTGPWKLADLENVKPNGLTVFSCFHCGGGSTMGYKLAGFNVLGGVDIDKDMVRLYRKNHNPKLSYEMGIQRFNRIPDHLLPPELFNLDILDGSPPCSSFSMAGAREKGWGEKKKFREGQAVQVLDDLFFHFIATAKRLKPKVVVAENVKGMLGGNAKFYVKQLFLCGASKMGVPQRRERVFFIAKRKDLKLPKILLNFDEPIVTLHEAFKNLGDQVGKEISPMLETAWHWCIKRNKSFLYNYFESPEGGSKSKCFNSLINYSARAAYTITASTRPISDKSPRYFSDQEITATQTFPEDYNYCNLDVGYVCGMSVPPFMMQRVADQIFKQWFQKVEQ